MMVWLVWYEGRLIEVCDSSAVATAYVFALVKVEGWARGLPEESFDITQHGVRSLTP